MEPIELTRAYRSVKSTRALLDAFLAYLEKCDWPMTDDDLEVINTMVEKCREEIQEAEKILQ